ncbi:hypothetical protein K491DRAFT_411502 [Lophiostoma macrostomum CBS 122681]|uniref:Uncharacterized protein n=1 Tax=Lophiostoma macrostomum CBS 122681 TaxID=1314788 RepID=A0A6A6T6Q4_9PLEO|nr:hypothetical protein K491DRAFT_411502 [Lophiostoma macrostomum CBS 122681]
MSHPNPHIATPIPFPQPAAIQTEQDSPAPNHASHSPTAPAHRSRTSTNASSSSAVNRIRSASIKLMEADPPPGMWAATGTVAAKAPTMEEIRTGSFNTSGWKEAEQRTAADRKLESLGKDEARMERDSFSQGAPSLGSAARLPLADARTALTGAHATVGVDDSCRRVIDEELRAPAEAMQYDSTNEGKDGAAEADSERSSEITQKTAEATPGRTGPERQVGKTPSCFLDAS